MKVLVGLTDYGMSVTLLWNAFQALGTEVFVTERPNIFEQVLGRSVRKDVQRGTALWWELLG
ncbi:MAG: hypothetical protein Q8S20_20670 [Sulfuritalea sp.]|nr:hypothetical protein [Sulfuritalea sp.]